MDRTETENPPPLHMDKYSRNQRLFETLVGMGVVCHPIYGPGMRIEAMYVSADLLSQEAAERCVQFPVEGPQVGNVVGPTGLSGNNVVNFPPIS